MKILLTTLLLSIVLLWVSCTQTKTPSLEQKGEVLSEDAAAKYKAEQDIAKVAENELQANLEDKELPTLASGNFVGIAPGHNAEGGVTLKDNGDSVIIELDADFVSDKGPDLYVILTEEQTLTGADPVQLDISKVTKIAPLVNLKWKQVYQISKAEYEAKNYAVGIWCNEFNVVFGAAKL